MRVKPRRVVHYAAHGGSGLAFTCYYTELKAHLASRFNISVIPHWRTERFKIRPPKRHTDLNRVTCPACWRVIRTMATIKLELEGK